MVERCGKLYAFHDLAFGLWPRLRPFITAVGGGPTRAWCALYLLFCYRFLPPDWQAANVSGNVREEGFDGRMEQLPREQGLATMPPGSASVSEFSLARMRTFIQFRRVIAAELSK